MRKGLTPEQYARSPYTEKELQSLAKNEVLKILVSSAVAIVVGLAAAVYLVSAGTTGPRDIEASVDALSDGMMYFFIFMFLTYGASFLVNGYGRPAVKGIPLFNTSLSGSEKMDFNITKVVNKDGSGDTGCFLSKMLIDNVKSQGREFVDLDVRVIEKLENEQQKNA